MLKEEKDKMLKNLDENKVEVVCKYFVIDFSFSDREVGFRDFSGFVFLEVDFYLLGGFRVLAVDELVLVI